MSFPFFFKGNTSSSQAECEENNAKRLKLHSYIRSASSNMEKPDIMDEDEFRYRQIYCLVFFFFMPIVYSIILFCRNQ